MTSEPVGKASGRFALLRIAVCIGCYVVVDFLLMSRAWFFTDEWLMVIIAVPLSQCSLVALWAATTQASLHLRFFLPPAATVASWIVMTRLLPWGIGDPAPVAWAIGLAIQTMSIIAGVKLYQLGTDASSRNQSRFRYDLRTLILWTIVIALVFAFVRFAREKWQWTSSIVEWDYFIAVPLFGLFSGLLAILWAWAFSAASWRRRSVKVAFAVFVISPSGFLVSYLLQWLSGAHPMSVQQSLVVFVPQSILLASALAIVRPYRWKPQFDRA